MANDSEVQLNWAKQIARMMEDQTRMMDKLCHLEQDATETKSRYNDLCAGLDKLNAHFTSTTAAQPAADNARLPNSPMYQPWSSTMSIPCAQGPPQNARQPPSGQTNYGQVDMSFTMQPPPDFATPRSGMPPMASSTEKKT